MDTRTVTLAEFLLARIGEDEAALGVNDGQPLGVHFITVASGERWLADCETKRRIVGLMRDRHPHYDWLHATDEERGEDRMHGLVGKLLALPYADHPDYRAEWRP